MKRFVCITAAFIFAFATGFAASAITMYARDGRTIDVAEDEVEAYTAVGWHADPFVTVYALDGRSLSVPGAQVEDYIKVGWYRELPTVTLYAEDGRTTDVSYPLVEAYTKVGWYIEPFVDMFSLDAKVTRVQPSEVKKYESSGWYTVSDNRTLYDFMCNSYIKRDPVRGYTFFYPAVTPYGNNGWLASSRKFVLPYIGTDGSEMCLRLIFNYKSSDWVFFTDITGVADGKRYTREFDYFDIVREIYRGGVYEYIDIPVGNSEITFLHNVANAKQAIVRFEGDHYYSDLYISEADKKAIGDTINVYYAMKKVFKLNY